MKWALPVLLLAVGHARLATAHRLDEYLQATLISIESDRVELEMNLTPGVSVLPVVLSMIDKDADGRISPEEQYAYAERLLRDVSLELDGQLVRLSLVEARFPDLEAMKTGLGTIRIKLNARRQGGHEIKFVNHHMTGISAYLVNCLVPASGGLAIRRQSRDYLQSELHLEYSLASDGFLTRVPPLALGGGMFITALLLFSLRRWLSGSGRVSDDARRCRNNPAKRRFAMRDAPV